MFGYVCSVVVHENRKRCGHNVQVRAVRNYNYIQWYEELRLVESHIALFHQQGGQLCKESAGFSK